MASRKKQLLIRESRSLNKFFVGYWDGNTGNSEKDFRCLGIRYSKEEAEKLLNWFLEKESWKYRKD